MPGGTFKRRKGLELGLTEFGLIMLALFIGMIIFVFLTKEGGFLDKVRETGCDLSSFITGFLKIIGINTSIC